jgi:hypothetical protein
VSDTTPTRPVVRELVVFGAGATGIFFVALLVVGVLDSWIVPLAALPAGLLFAGLMTAVQSGRMGQQVAALEAAPPGPPEPAGRTVARGALQAVAYAAVVGLVVVVLDGAGVALGIGFGAGLMQLELARRWRRWEVEHGVELRHRPAGRKAALRRALLGGTMPWVSVPAGG